MVKTISINFRPDDSSSISLIQDIVDTLRDNNVKVLLPDYKLPLNKKCSTCVVNKEEFVKLADLVVVVGGDGTFLHTARLFADSDVPIFGINRGRLGFLTEFSPQEYKKFLLETVSDNFKIAERIVMEAIHYRSGKEPTSYQFINDAVITKGAFSRIIHLELNLDDNFLNSYAGDGLIVATPTGSTAYSLSAGGPIVAPSVSDVYLLTPICAHTLAMRPMIIPNYSVLKAKVVSDYKNLLLTIDGQEGIEIGEDDEVVFKDTGKKIKLVTHPEKSYYAILREKLAWG